MARSTGSLLRNLILALGALGLAAALVVWWTRRPAPAPVFTTTTVTRADLVQNVTATGTLESVTEVEVSSQISGLILEVLVDYNTPVKAGDVLARIDPSTYEQRLKQAEANVASAIASAQLARLNSDRLRELRARNLVSQQELDQVEAQRAQTEASLLTQQASLADARVNLERCTIKAPIDGIVLDRATEKGKTVAASLNAPTLFTLVNNLSKMRIVASVAEADVGTVETGQPVSFTVDAFPGRTFSGTISQIRNAPKTVSNVVTYETVVDVDNRDLKLRPGMTANVSIVVARRDRALAVANSALRLRFPDSLLAERRLDPPPVPTPAASTPAPKPLTEEELRTARREILREAGFAFNGPPSPEVIAKAKEIAKARGIEIDFTRRPGRGGGAEGGGEGERPTPQVSSAPTSRTVFKLVGTDPRTARIQPLTVKLGITDGLNTEVLDSLAEGDVLITSVSVPTASTAAASNNPLAPRMGGPRR
ncbi:MAG TPA: efflux RND transporter periplasmic adaptor subunit [Opitutaceae bacterium]|nr:efflux RND transporter periplasmic adaptor subunit [Opitutaceae bacterium]